MTKLAIDHRLGAEAGFTLIEMLVVLGIIALVVTTAMPLLSGGSILIRTVAFGHRIRTDLYFLRPRP